MIKISRLMLATGFVATVGQALAFDEERARANLASDYPSCAAFYTVGAMCMARTAHGPGEITEEELQAQPLLQSAHAALEQGAIVSRQDVLMARYQLFVRNMMSNIEDDCSNVAPLLLEHQFCRTLLEKGPEDRMRYWMARP